MSEMIWKFPLALSLHSRRQHIEDVPQFARPLSAQWQEMNGQEGIVLWCLVDDWRPKVGMDVRIAHTGKPFDSVGFRFLSTVQAPSGLVYHVFVPVEPPQ